MISDEQLSPVGDSSVPVPSRVLRRLKRINSISELCPRSDTMDYERSDGEDLGKLGLQSGEGFDGFEEEGGLRSDVEGLGVEDGVSARKALDFDMVPEFDSVLEDLSEKGEERTGDLETGEEIRVSETKEAEKELPVSEASVPAFKSALKELGDNGEDESCDMETEEEIKVLETKESEREIVLETSVPVFNPQLEELGEKDDEEICDFESGEGTKVGETKETGKKRPDFETSDSEENESKRNKKRNKKNADFDELPVSSASMNMTKKERREYLDQLRAENQRLLRETRDAAFEPAPLVRKPILSVLEKIRRRKEEISKKFLSRRESYSLDTCDSIPKEAVADDNFEEVVAGDKSDAMNVNMASNQKIGKRSCSEDSVNPLGNSDNPSNKKTESNPTHQDPSLHSQMIDSEDELPEKKSKRSVEEVMTPSVVAMNLKLNPSHVSEDSSDEGENDKENADPEAHDSSPIEDPVRKFIDEDAEEEDDSDNDLHRFEDDDEDEDEEDDDLRDMIASQFKEDPKDKDRRNELHQKWLEQQDAAGTEKLLNKLKRAGLHDETSLSEDEDDVDNDKVADDADDEEGEESEANKDEDSSHAQSLRQTIKKMKEMIPFMFTDKDDVYVSSEDEEMEEKLLKQRLYNKRELKNKSSSSTRDDNSEEIFSRIRKPEIRKPEIQKKAKPSSLQEKVITGFNINPAASMSSFLGRITKSSISEGSRKRGTGVVRGYIFEREDRKSRNSKSALDEPSVSETIIQEKSRPKRAPAKFSASQSQERSTAEEEKSSRQRTSLYEILKMSSKKACFTSRDTVRSSSHTESIFAAFKVEKKPVKRNQST